MGGNAFKDQISGFSEGEADDDLKEFEIDEKERIEILKNVPKKPIPKKPPTPIPETPDALSEDVDEEEDPFGPQCMICMSRMQRGMLELKCGHPFHRRCLMPWVENVPKKGQRFLTQRARCPCCRGWAIASKAKNEEIVKSINDLVSPVVGQFQKMCDLLLQNKEIDESNKKAIESMKNAKKELPFMKTYVFYLCFDCGDVYFGGLKECEQEHGAEDEEKDRKDHVCVKCVNKRCNTNYPTKCEKHGENFIVFKCRYCCNIANYFCWGSTHFCERCHRKVDYTVYPCNPDECDGKHVKNGTEKENEQCLGCVLCRNNVIEEETE